MAAAEMFAVGRTGCFCGTVYIDRLFIEGFQFLKEKGLELC